MGSGKLHGRDFTNKGQRQECLWRIYNRGMANLVLVYGMRLLPADEIEEIGEAIIKLKNGREARVTMHVLEGSKRAIESQLQTSVESFFDLYPEI